MGLALHIIDSRIKHKIVHQKEGVLFILKPQKFKNAIVLLQLKKNVSTLHTFTELLLKAV